MEIKSKKFRSMSKAMSSLPELIPLLPPPSHPPTQLQVIKQMMDRPSLERQSVHSRDKASARARETRRGSARGRESEGERARAREREGREGGGTCRPFATSSEL